MAPPTCGRLGSLPAASLGESLEERARSLVCLTVISATSVFQLSTALCQAPHGTHVEVRASPPLTG